MMMKKESHIKSIEMPITQPQRESFRIKLNPSPLKEISRSQTAQSNYLSQITNSSRQETFTQSTSRISSLWERKDWHITEKRRENQLNSLFRVRKEKLEEITRENKNLYIRLNTQSSLYTHRERNNKEKYSLERNEEDRCYTFRTIDMRESREILGPIGNFNGLRLRNKSIASLEEQEENYEEVSKENSYKDVIKHKHSMTLTLKQNNKFKPKSKEQSDNNNKMRLSIRKKLGIFNNNNDNNENNQTKFLPNNLISRSNRYFEENKENEFVIATSKTARSSLLVSKKDHAVLLPEIYSLF